LYLAWRLRDVLCLVVISVFVALALLEILGALLAIPIAAAVQIIVRGQRCRVIARC
jgi:predicted PurR-regulated permease PerM